MTQDEYRVAIGKGMGRAVLAAKDTGLVYADAIIEACLHDCRFDPPTYETQAPYLHYIATQAGIEGRAVDAILAALPSTPAGRDRTGMIDLLGLFARTESQAAFDALVPLADEGDLRAQDALATSGDPGLEWVVEHILPRIPPDEQDFVWVWLVNGGWDDRTPTRARLREIREAAMRRASSGKRPSKPNPYFLKPVYEPWRDTRPPEQRGLVDDLAEDALQSGPASFSGSIFDENDSFRLRSIVEEYLRRKKRAAILNLIALPDGLVRSETACLILGEMDSPEVHEFGLELLSRRPLVPRALQSLKGTARLEDLGPVLAFLESAREANDTIRHAAAKDADEVARAAWKRPWQPLAEWVYEHAPSASARSSGFDWIIRMGKLSPEMLQEARYDVNDYTRDQAAERSRIARPPFLRFAARRGHSQ